MLTASEIIQIEKGRAARHQPSEEELRRIPLDRPVRLQGRLSSDPQVKESLQSMAEFAALVKLVRKDGIRTELSDVEVSRRLEAIRRGEPEAIRYWVDGQLIVDLRDLGLSGRLGPEKRPGLAELMADLSRGERRDVTGTVYLTSEGVSRLSRDQDRVVGYQLLKLMKGANCRVRTPYAIVNPRVDRDWKELAEGFEEAARESRRLQEYHFGPKIREKAEKGKYVGGPVPAGFIIEVEGYKSNGAYIFGKWQPYLPHVEVDIKVLKEYVRQGGSKYRAAQALRHVVYPLFPEELKYMETRSVLRRCPKTEGGYRMTPEFIEGLATNVRLIGMWKWADIVIENNHPAIVPPELFAQAYELAAQRKGKPRGRAAYFEPLDWDGLFRCLEHEAPRRVSGHGSEGKWVCDRDYHKGNGPLCLDINHEIISEPVTKEFLRCLDLTPHAQALLEQIEREATQTSLELARRQREEARLTARLANLETYLGQSDPELEGSYRRQIKDVKTQLETLQQKPMPPPVTEIDINRVRYFLGNLEAEWHNLSSALRNRLIKLLVEYVDLRHDRRRIEATIVWRNGLRQVIEIQRPQANSGREKTWTSQEDALLRMLWPSSPKEVVLAALPTRTWAGMTGRAIKLGIKRERARHRPPSGPRWTGEDDLRLTASYAGGVAIQEIAQELGRSVEAIGGRASVLGLKRPKEVRYRKPQIVWEVKNFELYKTPSP